MKDELARHNIEVIAISKDSVETAAVHKERDDLSMTLLADPDLNVIRQYGVEHHKAIEVSTGKFSLFGLHLAMVPSIKTMAIPTSLLIDEEGLVRWIDQTDDYRLRSHNERILEAVETAFTDPLPA
ncbi:MAG: peroxiredoxin [Limisphaerales bacterium]|jgi:peroxiredoxin